MSDLIARLAARVKLGRGEWLAWRGALLCALLTVAGLGEAHLSPVANPGAVVVLVPLGVGAVVTLCTAAIGKRALTDHAAAKNGNGHATPTGEGG